eukprot:TRINITY_DN2667_c0_g2_i18.p1 TRINITY_DN2667_c0_g2~~TRINITY_DN2667_c0_g2_i18.p1  ORF type:complete len:608 (-),score=85.05 TRINITY_DN2667_c0_g2_i18:151-1974(-)
MSYPSIDLEVCAYLSYFHNKFTANTTHAQIQETLHTILQNDDKIIGWCGDSIHAKVHKEIESASYRDTYLKYLEQDRDYRQFADDAKERFRQRAIPVYALNPRKLKEPILIEDRHLRPLADTRPEIIQVNNLPGYKALQRSPNKIAFLLSQIVNIKNAMISYQHTVYTMRAHRGLKIGDSWPTRWRIIDVLEKNVNFEIKQLRMDVTHFEKKIDAFGNQVEIESLRSQLATLIDENTWEKLRDTQANWNELKDRVCEFNKRVLNAIMNYQDTLEQEGKRINLSQGVEFPTDFENLYRDIRDHFDRIMTRGINEYGVCLAALENPTIIPEVGLENAIQALKTEIATLKTKLRDSIPALKTEYAKFWGGMQILYANYERAIQCFEEQPFVQDFKEVKALVLEFAKLNETGHILKAWKEQVQVCEEEKNRRRDFLQHIDRLITHMKQVSESELKLRSTAWNELQKVATKRMNEFLCCSSPVDIQRIAAAFGDDPLYPTRPQVAELPDQFDPEKETCNEALKRIERNLEVWLPEDMRQSLNYNCDLNLQQMYSMLEADAELTKELIELQIREIVLDAKRFQVPRKDEDIQQRAQIVKFILCFVLCLNQICI